MAISRDYLLNMILCISATHRQTLAPSPENKNIAILYRQKTFNAYNKALQVITAEKYETLLLTSLYMQVIVPPPDPPCTDTAMLEWLTTFLAIMQGLRILAGLKWASGIEKLSIFPIFRRELRKLPPPPLIWVQSDERSMFATDGPLGDTPSHPNPPATYSDGEESLRPVSAGVDSKSRILTESLLSRLSDQFLEQCIEQVSSSLGYSGQRVEHIDLTRSYSTTITPSQLHLSNP
jgi:hypothetical protein